MLKSFFRKPKPAKSAGKEKAPRDKPRKERPAPIDIEDFYAQVIATTDARHGSCDDTVVYVNFQMDRIGEALVAAWYIKKLYPAQRHVFVVPATGSESANAEAYDLVTEGDPTIRMLSKAELKPIANRQDGVVTRGSYRFVMVTAADLDERYQEHLAEGRDIGFITPGQRYLDRMEETLASVGLGMDKPLVTLHIRDALFTDMSRHLHRTCDPATYGAAVHRLIDEGYNVVRIGTPNCSPMGLKREGFVEAALMTERSKLLEPLATYHSEFYMGSYSGPCVMPRMLGKPILYVNCEPVFFGGTSELVDSIMAFKPFYDVAKGDFLTYDELIAHELWQGRTMYAFDLIEKGITWRNNTPEELLGAVGDMLAGPSNAHHPRHDTMRVTNEAYFKRHRSEGRCFTPHLTKARIAPSFLDLNPWF